MDVSKTAGSAASITVGFTILKDDAWNSQASLAAANIATPSAIGLIHAPKRAARFFTYMGPGEPPLLPNYDFLDAAADHLYTSKIFHDCNYLQANEGNIDPVHLSYLHRFLEVREEGYRGVRGAQESHYNLVARNSAPLIDVELVDFGLRIYTVRKLENDKSYLRVSYFILPSLSAFPGQTGGEGYSINWHVPIDDTHHWKYSFVYSAGAPLEKKNWSAASAPISVPITGWCAMRPIVFYKTASR